MLLARQSSREETSNLKNNLSWLAIVVVAGVAAVLTWFYAFELFSAVIGVIGVLIGAGIAYLIQTRTQRDSWKREYSVKIAETVYGALYGDVKGVVADLESKRFAVLNFGSWGQFQRDHRHLMVNRDFRQQLNKLSRNVAEYNQNVLTLIQEALPSIVLEASKEVFNLTMDYITIPSAVNIEVKYKHPNGYSDHASYTLLDCLTRRKNPREIVLESYPRSEIVSVQVQFRQAAPTRPQYPQTADEAKLNEFWKLCSELEQKSEVYKTVIQNQSLLLTESKSVFAELEKRIEEPWRI